METVKLLGMLEALMTTLSVKGASDALIDHVEDDPQAYAQTEEAINYLQMVFDSN